MHKCSRCLTETVPGGQGGNSQKVGVEMFSELFRSIMGKVGGLEASRPRGSTFEGRDIWRPIHHSVS